MTKLVRLMYGAALALTATAALAQKPVPPAPVAKVVPVTDTYFGEAIVDRYRWMENDKDPDWLPFLKQQNAHARGVLDARDALPGLGPRRRRCQLLRLQRQCPTRPTWGQLESEARLPHAQERWTALLPPCGRRSAPSTRPVRRDEPFHPDLLEACWWTPNLRERTYGSTESRTDARRCESRRCRLEAV